MTITSTIKIASSAGDIPKNSFFGSGSNLLLPFCYAKLYINGIMISLFVYLMEVPYIWDTIANKPSWVKQIMEEFKRVIHRILILPPDFLQIYYIEFKHTDLAGF